MTAPVTVISSKAQPNSGVPSNGLLPAAGNTTIGGNVKQENVDTAPGNGTQGWVKFSVVEGYGSAVPAPTFETISETGQFTVTSGYSKINVVDVPQRIGVTVFAGFDPVTATLPILFDNFGGTTGVDTHIEKAINMLEWMAGRGEAVNGHVAPAAARESKPPAVRVVSNDVNGNPTGIIPHQYRHVKWIITGLAWGYSIRDANGNRQRQKVTVTLMEENGTPDYSPTEAFKATNPTRKWRAYTVPAQGDNTCLKIAKNVLKQSGATAKKEAEAIKNQNNGKNGLSIRSIESVIRAKAKIQIPG